MPRCRIFLGGSFEFCLTALSGANLSESTTASRNAHSAFAGELPHCTPVLIQVCLPANFGKEENISPSICVRSLYANIFCSLMPIYLLSIVVDASQFAISDSRRFSFSIYSRPIINCRRLIPARKEIACRVKIVNVFPVNLNCVAWRKIASIKWRCDRTFGNRRFN